MRIIRLKDLLILVLALAVLASCGRDHPVGLQDSSGPYDLGTKDGTEDLGPPSIPIAAGSGFAEGGAGLESVGSAEITVDVPAGATINQVLLYWSGASAGGPADDEITLDGIPVQGQLIGGPTLFFSTYEFSAFRADITDLDLIAPGANAVTVAGFDNPTTWTDENNGASILVIYDDGSAAAMELRDGLDMAYFGFQPTLDATVPQVFRVTPSTIARTADLMLMVSSVGENRPNSLKITTAAGVEIFENVLNSSDGPAWDSLIRTIDIPAGVEEVAVQVISTDSADPQGASMGWVAAGLVVADTGFPVAGTVIIDADLDGAQSPLEIGLENVWVQLEDAQGIVATATTGMDGTFLFAVPAGSYTLRVPLGTGPGQFNYDLAQSFEPTTVLEIPVTVGPGSLGNVFGFVPQAASILEDLETGELVSEGLDLEYWTETFREVLACQILSAGVTPVVDGAERMDFEYECADGNEAWLRELVDGIEGLYLEEPYQFAERRELWDVFRILRDHPQDDLGFLYRELLVTELNYLAGFGLVGEEDRLGALIAWGEALVNLGPEDPAAKAGNKDARRDLRTAFQIFEAINTGGGGGVDE